MKLRDCDPITRLMRTRPLMLASLLFLTGCVLGHACALSRAVWAGLAALPCAAAALAAAAQSARARRLIPALLMLALLPLGGLRFALAWNGIDRVADQKPVALCARIAESPVWNAERERLTCLLDEVTLDGTPRKYALRLYLRNADALAAQALPLGSRISASVSLWAADGASNPGEFDFSEYLALNGIAGYATAEFSEIGIGEPALRARDLPERIRIALGGRIDRLFPKSAALVRAFVLGDRQHLSAEDRERFSLAGVAHLLAISGMHISVLALMLSRLFGLALNRRAAFSLTLGLLLLYGLLIGYTPSLTRAVVMFAVAGCAPLFGRASDAPTRLSAALLLYLLIRPVAILESGFVLSFCASAGLIFLYDPLERLFRARKYLRSSPGPGLRTALTRRLPRYLVGLLLASLSAQLAVLPAVVESFGAQPLFSLVSNLVAVPLAMLAYITSLLGTLTGLAPVAAAGDELFSLLTAAVRFFAGLPLNAVRIARFPTWLVLICAAAIPAASELSRLPARVRRFLPLTIVLAACVSTGLSMLSTLGVSVVFLDAGQADCAVVRAQGSVCLIDTGDADYSPAADYLSATAYPLKAIFLTHPHDDHAGGLAGVLRVCTPDTIYLPEGWAHYECTQAVSDALQAAESRGVRIEHLSAGDEVALSGEVTLKVLSPEAGFTPDSANDLSLVLLLEYGDAHAMFCGDISVTEEPQALPDIDLLKVAHHGSARSVSREYLAALTPALSVISVGENSYGHPTERALGLLADAGSEILRTDERGAISCKIGADGTLRYSCYFPASRIEAVE